MDMMRVVGDDWSGIWNEDWTKKDQKAAMRWCRYLKVKQFAYVNPYVAVALTEEGDVVELAWHANQKLQRCASMHPDFTMFRTDDDTVLIAMRFGVTVLGEKGMWERDSACPWLLRSLGVMACEDERIRAIVYKDSPDEEYDEAFDVEDDEDEEAEEDDEDSPEGENDQEA